MLQQPIEIERERYTEDDYDDMLNDCYPLIEIGCIKLDPSRVLQECDPIAYNCGFSDYQESETVYKCPICEEGHEEEEEALYCCQEECIQTENEEVRIGQPYKRILVKANIIRCKHPDASYSDFAKYKEGHIQTLGAESWEELYGNYDNLPSIKNGNLILSGREDKNGGEIVNKLVNINARWNGSGLLIYDPNHSHVFYRVDLISDLPATTEVEEDIEMKHRK